MLQAAAAAMEVLAVREELVAQASLGSLSINSSMSSKQQLQLPPSV